MSSSEVDNAVIAAGLAEKLQFAHNTWKSGREIESEIEEKREKTEEIEGRRGIERVEGQKRDKDREGYREREKENEGEREGGIEKGRERGEMFEMELEYSPRSNVENRDIHKNNKSNNLIRSNNNNTTVNRNRRSKSVQSANIRFPSTAANIERGGLETEEEIQSRKSHETIESNNSDILNDSEAVTLPSYTSTSSTSSTSTSTSSMSQTMQNIKMLTLLASSNKISPTTFSAMMKIAHLPILGTLINSYLITIQHSDGITTKNLFPSISSSKDEPITLIDRLLLSKQLQTTPFFLLGPYFHSFSSIFSSIFSFFIILFLIYFHAIAIVHHGISTLQTTSTSSASSTLSTISTGITPIITSGIASPLSTISIFSSISSTAVPLVISPIFTLFMSNYQRAIFPYLDKMSLPTFKFLPTSISTLILTYIQYIASFAYICLDYISKNYLPESYMPLIKIPISTTSDDILSETNSSLSFTMILDQNSATYWFGISLLCYIIQYVGIITIIASAAYVYSKLDQRFDLSRDISTCIQQVNLIVRTRYYSARGYTCADIFEYYANKYQDRPFLVHNGITWSYRDANFLANRIARWYHSMNIHKNDVVAIAMGNCPEYIILWLAAHKVGACAALINYNLTGEPLLHSIRVAAPRVVICDSKMIKNILECRVEAEEEIQRIPIFIYDTLDIAADDAFVENTDDNDSLSLSVVGSVDQDNKGATIIRPGSSSNNGIKHNQPSINAINGKKDSSTNNGSGSMISNRRISSDELITTNNIKNSTKNTNNSSPKMSHINENLTFSTVTSPISSPTSLETYLKEKNVFPLANIFANDDSDTFNGQPTPKEWRKDTTFDDIGLLIYTSGTTGLPKAARLPHSRIYGGGYLFGFRFGVRDNDRIYNVLPLYHSSGGVLTTFLVVTCGGAMIIRNKFSARNFWSDCAKYDATVAMYIGELCRYLLQTPPSVYDKNHKVRLCIGNGLRPEIWGEFQERFNVPHIGEFYASTEGNAALFNFCRDIESRGAIGHMGSFVEYMSNMRLIKLDSEGVPILDKDGHCIQVGENEAGELISKIITWDPIRNFSGYHKNKKGTENKILKNVFTKGDSYFRTGDLLRKDRNNLWHFVDRIGDTFRWKGENVSTAEVAQVVSKYDIYMKNINNSHEATIEECNIYGVQIPNHDGRACCAALTLVPGKKLNFETFAQYVTTSLPGYAVPAFVRILKDGMETTSTFKHKKNELRDEGIDLSLIRNDEMYVLLNKKYHKLTPNIIDDITALKAKL